jgi:hypothetical protein
MWQRSLFNPAMNRLLTAPSVGAFVGAIEGGIVFRTLTVIDSRSGPWLGGDETTIMIGFVLGLIVGGFAGVVIGIVVALTKARWLLGLSIGTLAGLLIAAYIFLSGTRDENILRALGGLSIPCLGSVGLLSAVLTSFSRLKSE